MSADQVMEAIRSGMEGIFSCSVSPQYGDYVRVTTPLRYPDGERIDLFYKASPEGVVLSDLGETVRWISHHLLDRDKLSEVVPPVEETYQVKMVRGRVESSYLENESLVEALFRLGMACLAISQTFSRDHQLSMVGG